MEDSWPHLMLGRRCCDILRPGETDEACLVERSISEGRSVTLEVTPERYNRPLLVTVEPVIESESNTVGAVCTARDLSERASGGVARERQSLLNEYLETVRDPSARLIRRPSCVNTRPRKRRLHSEDCSDNITGDVASVRFRKGALEFESALNCDRAPTKYVSDTRRQVRDALFTTRRLRRVKLRRARHCPRHHRHNHINDRRAAKASRAGHWHPGAA